MLLLELKKGEYFLRRLYLKIDIEVVLYRGRSIMKEETLGQV